ncbi:hypothetical protein FE783_04305 [Paenibacillus mesophilus]|uniref:Hsp20/alpha crystallin family protein n=1 Tax=Paenibacillus mesophilus TaxID=2582849 RepID=UPI00110D843F|nr:Hsp20/alpha crystallin family protein [Paenibacillus mesophilus]TMV52173.1 hypothetical protein FE783_04305 [Paenibacillus mesophilus]
MSRSKDGQAMQGAGEPLFDWDEFQNSFFGAGGWKEAWSGNPAGAIPWVDRYVKGILADAVPGAVQKASSQTGQSPPSSSKLSSAASNVFETHHAVIVRIRLSADVVPHHIRLHASPNEIVVSGLPGDEDKLVKLPAVIRVEGAKAICKQGILEITLPKGGDNPVKEILIRHVD